MYWQVGPKESDYTLTVTTNPKRASVFRIIPAEETEDAFDFSIGWQSQSLQDLLDEITPLGTEKVVNPKMFRYLDVSTKSAWTTQNEIKIKC